MTQDIYENAARALVGYDGKLETDRPPSSPATPMARAAERTEDALASGALALRDAFLRGLALAACSHAAIPLESLSEKSDPQ